MSSGPVAVRFNLVTAFQTYLSVISSTLTFTEICTGFVFRNSRSNVQANKRQGFAKSILEKSKEMYEHVGFLVECVSQNLYGCCFQPRFLVEFIFTVVDF